MSGQLAGVYADFNDHVRRGQLLARLDTTVLHEAVVEANASLDAARATLDQREFELQQQQQLHDSHVATESEYQTARFNAASARANLESAQANLERARRNLDFARISSPIDGVVVERNVEVGQTVAASLSAPQLFLIAGNLEHMQILAAVDEADIGSIHTAQPVHFTVQAWPNDQFTGSVEQIRLNPTTTDNVVSYTVVVDVPNPGTRLLPGMTATVAFQIARAENVLEIPNAALRFRPTQAMLAAVQRPGSRGPGSGQPAGATTSGAGDSGRAGGRTREGDRAGRGGGAQGGRGAGPRDRAAAAGPGDSSGFTQAGGEDNVAWLWYVDASGRLAVTAVRTGMTDGQMTQVIGSDLSAGMNVIAGVTGGAPAESEATNPFQSNQPRGRGGFRGVF